MKCAACGYEHKADEYEDQEIRYKTGKKKGQLKEKRRVLAKTYKKFIEVNVMDRLQFTVSDKHRGWGDPDYYEVSVVACPECGTLKLDSWRHNFD